MIKMVGYDMAKHCAAKLYEKAGLGPKDVQVVELHDCFTANELLTYEALGLCPEGEAEKFIWDGDNTYGGKWVTNPSGGLLSKGHPLGATGLAQCTELVWQLRGQAEQRQVEGARVALQHNLGLGGACVVTLYLRLNRRYQDEARAAVLADPAAIVARWGSGSDERILAERGLFIGRDFHPFASGYQTLVGARMVDDRVLELEFDILGADGTHRRAVDVPPAALPAVREFLARRR
jgi:hypothetical protein